MEENYKETKIRVNKYPFLLWLCYEKELEIDFLNKKVKSDIAVSKIEKVSNWKIFILKYFIFIFLILSFGIYPINLIEFGIFIGSIFVTSISYFVLIKFTKYFIKYLILITLTGYLIIFNYAEHIQLVDLFSVYTTEIVITAILIRDIILKKYQNYYYLKDIKKKNKVNIAKKHNRPLIPFWKNKGLFRIQRGFNLGFNFSIGGFYFRIENEK
ncbi:hypothetical protein [Arcobacter sp.]|uniref:hypothetical protein n=1 Tax=unclassified Arcobacter TaxID=2593671 RepID=UPI003B0043B2